MPEAHSLKQSIRKVHWRATLQATIITETFPLALGTQKLERGKAGRCFRNHHSIPLEVLTHLPCHRLHFLTMLEFAPPRILSFLTKATHKNQSEMNHAFLKWQGNNMFYSALLHVVPHILSALSFWFWDDVFGELSARMLCFTTAKWMDFN